MLMVVGSMVQISSPFRESGLKITFDRMLQNMDCIYEKGLNEIRKLINNWMYRSLSIFCKITVVKTFVLSKITHIAAVLLTPSPKECKVFDDVLQDFIRGKNPEGKTKNSLGPFKYCIPQRNCLDFSFKIIMNSCPHWKSLGVENNKRTQHGIPFT